ncbi:MAG: sulfatase-like hydrolase/transferase [Verrucomicrobiota bacterium]
MNRIAFFLLSLTFLSTHAFAEPARPNIVFFFSDDLGYADLGCYGHPYAKTPALDQLAEEGTRFEQHYVTGVTCNPSRTGLMTGLFPARFEKYAADFGFGDRVSITELLKEAGYMTGHFGKWHIGPKSTEVAGTYGLDVVEIIGKSQGKKAGRDDELTTAAIEFMKENAGEQPFYINIWGHSTHYPVYAADSKAAVFKDVEVNRADFSESMQEKFDQSLELDKNLDRSMHQYLGDVYSVDENVGRVLKAIDELGIRENTIFVYSSDHGPAPVVLGKQGVREYSKNMLGYAGQFRGGKHNQLEGGVRVPFIVRWPGKVEAGRVDAESVTSFIDWMPTLAAIAGIEGLPEQLDGEDVSDIWFGATRERTQPLFWKTSSSSAVVTIRDGKWKMHEEGRREPAQLYDLSVDPEERNNLAEELPEVAAKLQESIDGWKSELPASYVKAGDKKKDRE